MAPLQDRGCDSLSPSAERDAASVFYFVSFGARLNLFSERVIPRIFYRVNVSVTSG